MLGQRLQRQLEALPTNLIVAVDERLQALAAALEVEHRLTADEHDLGTGDAGRALGALALGPRQRGAVGLRRIDRAQHDGLLGATLALAQPLDRAGDRELGAAEPLDEVATAGNAEHLELRQLRVDPAEPAGDALGEHLLARQHAVALEQQLGLRAPARARIGIA